MMLKTAQQAVDRMWNDVAMRSTIRMASPNDVLFFLHEEASEVTKAAMTLGLIGDARYTRSPEAEAKQVTLLNLIQEIGDVLLMALTLAIAFDFDASVCLEESLQKFQQRADRHPNVGPVDISVIQRDPPNW